jgi:DNA-binding NarL/FixJ family response regulator
VSLRVLLADEHEPTLVGMRHALEHAGIEIVAEVANGPDAVVAAMGSHPDVAVLDVDMPGGAIEATAQIARELPDTAVVMFGGTPRDEDLFAALRAGARGFLLKDTNPDRLPYAIAGVANGEAALPRTLMARVIEEFRRGERSRVPLIGPSGETASQREWEVLALMAEGLSTREIAERVGISEVTVRRHVSASVRKLGVTDRAAAVDAFRAASAGGSSAPPSGS